MSGITPSLYPTNRIRINGPINGPTRGEEITSNDTHADDTYADDTYVVQIMDDMTFSKGNDTNNDTIQVPPSVSLVSPYLHVLSRILKSLGTSVSTLEPPSPSSPPPPPLTLNVINPRTQSKVISEFIKAWLTLRHIPFSSKSLQTFTTKYQKQGATKPMPELPAISVTFGPAQALMSWGVKTGLVIYLCRSEVYVSAVFEGRVIEGIKDVYDLHEIISSSEEVDSWSSIISRFLVPPGPGITPLEEIAVRAVSECPIDCRRCVAGNLFIIGDEVYHIDDVLESAIFDTPLTEARMSKEYRRRGGGEVEFKVRGRGQVRRECAVWLGAAVGEEIRKIKEGDIGGGL